MRGGLLDTQPGVIGLVSQYSHISIGLSIGLYLLLCRALYNMHKGKNGILQLLGILTPVIIYGLLLANSLSKMDNNVKPIVMLHEANAFAVQNYQEVPETIRHSYVHPTDVTEEIKWMKREHLSLFAETTVYSYPYDDFEEYYISKPVDSISGAWARIPEAKSLFWVDFIDGTVCESKGLTKSSDYLEVSGWALDESVKGAPSSLYLSIDEKYYPAEWINRADVVEVYFGDEASTTDVGFFVRVATGMLPEGDHSVNLILVYADGSFFETYLTMLSIQSDAF